jgi:hypothetical protein
MARKVFISYRREDSAGSAGRVHDRLIPEFGREALFMDVDKVRAGMNFVKMIREEVAKCDVLLAIIGPNWLNAQDEEGNRRLDNQNDYVRIEIAAALLRDIPVIPILLDGARIPKSNQLPKDLEELEQRSGLEIRHTSFDSDIDRLIRELKGSSDRADDPRIAGKPLPRNVIPAPIPLKSRAVLGWASIGVSAICFLLSFLLNSRDATPVFCILGVLFLIFGALTIASCLPNRS